MITRTRTDDGKGGFTEILTEEQSSAELSRNSKGDYVWTLKVYKDTAGAYVKTAKEFLEAIAEVKEAAIKLGL